MAAKVNKDDEIYDVLWLADFAKNVQVKQKYEGKDFISYRIWDPNTTKKCVICDRVHDCDSWG